MAKFNKAANKAAYKMKKLEGKQAIKKTLLENEGKTGRNARKMENSKEKWKTIRRTAYAASAADAAKANAEARNNATLALQKWNTLINGSEEPGNNKQPKDVSDTTDGDILYV